MATAPQEPKLSDSDEEETTSSSLSEWTTDPKKLKGPERFKSSGKKREPLKKLSRAERMRKQMATEKEPGSRGRNISAKSRIRGSTKQSWSKKGAEAEKKRAKDKKEKSLVGRIKKGFKMVFGRLVKVKNESTSTYADALIEAIYETEPVNEAKDRALKATVMSLAKSTLRSLINAGMDPEYTRIRSSGPSQVAPGYQVIIEADYPKPIQRLTDLKPWHDGLTKAGWKKASWGNALFVHTGSRRYIHTKHPRIDGVSEEVIGCPTFMIVAYDAIDEATAKGITSYEVPKPQFRKPEGDESKTGEAERLVQHLKREAKFKDIYWDHYKGKSVWIGLRDNRDPEAHSKRVEELFKVLTKMGWTSKRNKREGRTTALIARPKETRQKGQHSPEALANRPKSVTIRGVVGKVFVHYDDSILLPNLPASMNAGLQGKKMDASELHMRKEYEYLATSRYGRPPAGKWSWKVGTTIVNGGDGSKKPKWTGGANTNEALEESGYVDRTDVVYKAKDGYWYVELGYRPRKYAGPFRDEKSVWAWVDNQYGPAENNKVDKSGRRNAPKKAEDPGQMKGLGPGPVSPAMMATFTRRHEETELKEWHVEIDRNGYAMDDEGNRWYVGTEWKPGIYGLHDGLPGPQGPPKKPPPTKLGVLGSEHITEIAKQLGVKNPRIHTSSDHAWSFLKIGPKVEVEIDVQPGEIKWKVKDKWVKVAAGKVKTKGKRPTRELKAVAQAVRDALPEV